MQYVFCGPQPLEPTPQVPPFHHTLWKAQDKQKARKEQMEEVREAAVHSATAKTNTDCTDVFNYFELMLREINAYSRSVAGADSLQQF